MSGDKLKLVLKTLKFIVTQLKPGDSFAMVTFDDIVDTNLPLCKMNSDGRATAQSKIEKIFAGGSTNLSGGLFAGLELLKNHPVTEKEITSVLLMTDGHANVGIQDSPTLTEGLRKQLAEVKTPCTVFTFGYGTDHDDKMLKSLSETGKGLYYFLENEDSIPQAFADCLGGLISVVGQNLKLRIEPMSGTNIAKVSTKFKTEEFKSETGEKIVEVSIGDIYSEEQRDIVCEVELPPLPNDATQCNILKFKLNYFNVVSTNSDNAETVVVIDRPTDDSASRIADPVVDKQRNRIIAADALERANALGSEEKLDEAREALKGAMEKIKNSISASQLFCVELLKDLEQAHTRIKDSSTYRTSGSKYMSSMTMTHSYQRCSHSSTSYRTSAKNQTMHSYADQDDENEHEP
jgi:hypothetical protein